MITNRQSFEYQKHPLIERITIQPPFRFSAVFQNNEGCFIYVRGTKTNIKSASQNLSLDDKEAVLLKCGTYFVDLLKHASNNEIEVFVVHLYPQLLKDLYRHELPRLVQQKLEGQSIRKIVPENTLSVFIDNLEFYFSNPGLVNDDLLELKIKELILILIQTRNVDSVVQLISELFTPATTGLKEVVSLHMYSDLSITQLAELCHMSTTTFTREFKKLYADSPGNYILTQRLKKAKTLLRMSDMRIADIASDIGFRDPAYFTRRFKQHTGQTPSEYRIDNPIKKS